MLRQLVVRHLGQILMQLFDHHLGRRFAQRVFEFRDYAWRRHKHELIEVPILELGGERVRYGADEVLFGGLVQVAKRGLWYVIADGGRARLVWSKSCIRI
jgi:hypothetical protein